MSDTSVVDTPTPQPPTKLEAFKGFFGDLARPFAIMITSLSAAVTPIVVVARIAPDRLDLIGAAALIGAVYAGVGGIYTAKSWEVRGQAKAQAQVEIAKSNTVTP